MINSNDDGQTCFKSQVDAVPVSVVIPLYNNADSICRAVESVVSQLHVEDEVIIVDDGSTDGGDVVIERQYGHMPCIHIAHQSNQGVSVARNRGWRASAHQHIIFLDADDWWLPGLRNKINDMTRDWPNAVAWSVGHYRVDGTNQHTARHGLTDQKSLGGAQFINQYARYSGVINSSSVCVSKHSLVSIGGFPEGATTGEDIYVWLRLALLGEIAVCPDFLVAIDRPTLQRKKKPRREAVGFFMRYFGRPDVIRSLTVTEQRAIKRFLISKGISQVAGLIVEGRRLNAVSIARSIGRVAPQFWIYVASLIVLPKQLYLHAYKRRHGLRYSAKSVSVWLF